MFCRYCLPTHICSCLPYPECSKSSNLPTPNKHKYWFAAARMFGRSGESFFQRICGVGTTAREPSTTFSRLLQCIAGKQNKTKQRRKKLSTNRLSDLAPVFKHDMLSQSRCFTASFWRDLTSSISSQTPHWGTLTLQRTCTGSACACSKWGQISGTSHVSLLMTAYVGSAGIGWLVWWESSGTTWGMWHSCHALKASQKWMAVM